MHGRAVANARVEGSGMRGGMITGEGPFTVRTLTNADGRFTLVSSDWPSYTEVLPRVFYFCV